MSLSRRNANSHPRPEVLALFARRDLPLLSHLRVRSHVRQCQVCERQTLLINSAVGELKREAAAETLTAFEAIADWKALEREMLGNIVVGVSAARCIEKVLGKPKWLTRGLVAAGLSALFVGGWLTHIPPAETRHLVSSLSRFVGFERLPGPANIVQTTANGIAVRSQGVTLTILHPPTARVSLSGNSSVQARYIDEDTGQLTITNVYGQ
ncbi:MAG: hypothetical protein M3Y24_12855 [Acidobacteriota bacterium]|nr:hypothetical protein [Acidobacteriota bacterium]